MQSKIKKLFNYLNKQAANLAGGEPDAPVEQAFGSLAHNYIKDKAPKLMDFEVGFQLLKKSDDNTRIAGIFGFQVGDTLLMIPVFFLNGDLKGHELLYISNHDIFVPLTEGWVNYLLGRKPIVLGDSVDRNLRNIGVMPPSLQSMVGPPFNKLSFDIKYIQSWAKPFINQVVKVASTNPDKFLRKVNSISLQKFIKKAGLPAVNFIKNNLLYKYPFIVAGFEKFNPGLLDNILHRHELQQKQASSILNQKNNINLSTSKNKNIEIYDLEKIGAENIVILEISSAEKTILLQDGYFIKDKRDDKNKTKIYLDSPVSLHNPTETGIYNVLLSPYKVVKCAILMHPRQKNGRSQNCIVIFLDEKRENKYLYLIVPPQSVWVTTQEPLRLFHEWFESLPDETPLETIKNKKISACNCGCSCPVDYILVNKSGDCTLPFYIIPDIELASKDYFDSDEEYDNYVKQVFVNFVKDTPLDSYGYCGGARSYANKLSSNTKKFGYGNSFYKMLFLENDGDKLKTGSGEMWVPSKFKAIPCIYAWHSSTDAASYTLGNANIIQTAIISHTKPVIIKSAGSLFYVNDKQLPKKQALFSLVLDYGLSEKDAKYVLKEAAESPEKLIKFRIKKSNTISNLAAGGNFLGSLPDMESIGMGSSVGMANYPVQYSDPQLTSMQDPNVRPRSDYNYFDLNQVDNSLMQVAQQAAQMGQKELFETSALSSLLNAANEDLIDKFMGDWIKGLDRLGRVLFVLYWHRDMFEDRYGRSELPEIEDALRNSFVNMGEVVLKLKSKNVDPLPTPGLAVDLEHIANT